jgi:hypothetical protein
MTSITLLIGSAIFAVSIVALLHHALERFDLSKGPLCPICKRWKCPFFHEEPR